MCETSGLVAIVGLTEVHITTRSMSGAVITNYGKYMFLYLRDGFPLGTMDGVRLLWMVQYLTTFIVCIALWYLLRSLELPIRVKLPAEPALTALRNALWH